MVKRVPSAAGSAAHVGELDDLGAALARTVSALERVSLDALEARDRDLLFKALTEARGALAEYRRATRPPEPFPQED
jgi:alpha-galactosidase/6-phospho-beta-glucosidase family protein